MNKMNQKSQFDDPSALNQFPARSNQARQRTNRVFYCLCLLVSFLSIVILAVLLVEITRRGVSGLDLKFIRGLPDSNPELAGIFPSMMGTIWVCATCAILTIPIGVATAIFLEEYKPKNIVFRFFHGVIQLNISNLAGVPSVVYGIIGMTCFVYIFGLLGDPQNPSVEIGAVYYDQFRTSYRDENGRVYMLRVPVDSRTSEPTKIRDGMEAEDPEGQTVKVLALAWDDPKPASEVDRKRAIDVTEDAGRYAEQRWYYFRLPIGRSVLAASLTLMLVILPVIIISSQEAIRAVPSSLREGALGLGATRWQVVRNVTLPASIPGIMTGSILAMSRAIGEAAPMLLIAGVVFISFAPSSLFDNFTVMPLQIYDWAKRPNEEFHQLAATGIILLLGILLSFNAVAVMIRQLTQKRLS